MKRLRRAGIAAVATFGTLSVFLFVLHLLLRPNPELAQAEQYAVLSAYIEPGLTGDSHDLGSRRGTVVIFDTPTFSSQLVKNTPARQYVLLVSSTGHPKHTIPQLRAALLFEFYATNLHRVKFEEKLEIPARYRLATQQDLDLYATEEFQVRFPSSYGYLTFSRVAFNSDLTEAFFYTEHICGLCGEGKWVFMRKRAGKWSVENTASTWIS